MAHPRPTGNQVKTSVRHHPPYAKGAQARSLVDEQAMKNVLANVPGAGR